MKFITLVAAFLAFASSTTTSAEARRTRGGSSAASRCRSNYQCPSNSYRIPNRNCYDSFNDCACDTGYYKSDGQCVKDLEITINNLSFQQPFSSFFVMIHSDDAEPLYRQGEQASEPLALLAENGDPAPLVDFYQSQPGVFAVANIPGPLPPSGRKVLKVRVNDKYDRITIATMQINTNDCFTAVNGLKLKPGDVLNLPGLDAGSEENNERCTSIPGPACPGASGNVRSGNGEGFVHVHRGFHGINEGVIFANPLDNGDNGSPLTAVGYDWRNPLMRVTVTKFD